MRAVNERRAVVEYARVHRIIHQGQLMPADTDFPSNVLDRLQRAEGRSATWYGRTWRLGDVAQISRGEYQEAARLPEGRAITGRHGWAEEVESGELAPRYDEKKHSWQVEPLVRLDGAVGLFVLDLGSQIMAITNYSGRDLSLPGFCRTMTDLLNDVERERRSEAYASVEWHVEPLDERGTFAQWLTTVETVTRITADFHLPNPAPRHILEPAFELLDGLNATKTILTAESSKPTGLNPNGHPLMQGALAMQEEAYGEVRAVGTEPSGDESKYNSRDFRARDAVEPPDLAVSGLIAMLLRVLASRVERRARERGDR
jgi:hypothetical protein